MRAAFDDFRGEAAHQLNLFEAERVGRPAVGCWFVTDEAGLPSTAQTLLSSRHVFLDADTGRVAVSDDDLILLRGPGGGELVCLGPAWLRGLLPSAFRRNGLRFWEPPCSERSVSVFRRRVACSPWLAFTIDARARSAPMLAEHDGTAHAIRNVEGRGRGDRGLRARSAKAGALAFLTSFASGVALAGSAPASEASLFEAKAALQQALGSSRVAPSKSWTAEAERLLSEVEDRLFGFRQHRLAGIRLADRVTDSPVDAEIHSEMISVFGIPLPPVPLPSTTPRPDAMAAGRREELFTIPLSNQTLRPWLPTTRGGQLRASVSFGRRSRHMGETTTRLGLGSTCTVSALLDNEVHQLVGIPSCGDDADTLTVFADGNGVTVSPSVKQGRIGHPISFKATGRQSGLHAVRFTFLTRNRVVSKVLRTVEVFDT